MSARVISSSLPGNLEENIIIAVNIIKTHSFDCLKVREVRRIQVLHKIVGSLVIEAVNCN